MNTIISLDSIDELMNKMVLNQDEIKMIEKKIKSDKIICKYNNLFNPVIS